MNSKYWGMGILVRYAGEKVFFGNLVDRKQEVR